jgi:hypothetical protein
MLSLQYNLVNFGAETSPGVLVSESIKGGKTVGGQTLGAATSERPATERCGCLNTKSRASCTRGRTENSSATHFNSELNSELPAIQNWQPLETRNRSAKKRAAPSQPLQDDLTTPCS